ncbi:hypothetical protein FOMG_17314 [Fusarium oxysporum f. sp. melonis 26406]|uniref:Xylanolytic transcriptional activator regulatory domain-containing protein n=1 Tax=Fusarium oxysporum f. sp. melonis 26406 TaxID=1089452 RepID=W9Z2U0_FUSOX|nr:hypothetical protein FOMG_17314 [Fusarium oxysporum f. sp. melonis 26406]
MGRLERLEALQVSHPAAVVYRAIQTRPEAEVHEVVRRIRAGANAETIARQLSTADPLLQVQLEPETRYRYQFLYSPLMPSYLQTPSNPFIHSLIHEWNENDHAGNVSVPRLSESEERYKAQYLRPVHAASIVDHRMDEVVPSKWTTVNADDSLMRTFIRAYFLQEYDWFTFFHKDYFLDDMLAGSNTFCSPLLVNAILAVGCHCQNYLAQLAEFWNPNSLGYKFLAEAKRLWAVEESEGIRSSCCLLNFINMTGLATYTDAIVTLQPSQLQKLESLGLYYNLPEPAIICIEYGFAINPTRAPRHPGDKHHICPPWFEATNLFPKSSKPRDTSTATKRLAASPKPYGTQLLGL